MAPVLPATRCRLHVFDDSQRWERFTPRPDAIPHRRFIKTHSPADCIHLASWWPQRHEPFVLLVHYALGQRPELLGT